jgi:soluble lytic murein transglycosylase-like protein
MPRTWDAYGEGDIDDPHDSIRAAARYLAANGGGRGELENALFHYNRSNRYVRGVLHYASVIGEHSRAFRAYYNWGIWYLTAHGDVYLPVGYEEHEPVPVLEYLERAG